jgi:hypothetical protein
MNLESLTPVSKSTIETEQVKESYYGREIRELEKDTAERQKEIELLLDMEREVPTGTKATEEQQANFLARAATLARFEKLGLGSEEVFIKSVLRRNEQGETAFAGEVDAHQDYIKNNAAEIRKFKEWERAQQKVTENE